MKLNRVGYQVVGNSSRQFPIGAHRFGGAGPTILFLGGVHGDESEGVVLAHHLVARLCTHFDFALDVLVIPAVNPDGVLDRTRCNARNVDLNRNLPTKDWNPKTLNPRYPPGPFAGSEPENQTLLEVIEVFKPKLVVSFHSWHPMLNVNGPSQEYAEVLSAYTGLQITTDMGYPTPGSLGTYLGAERSIPTITYEIEQGMPLDKVAPFHLPAVIELLKYFEKKAHK